MNQMFSDPVVSVPELNQNINTVFWWERNMRFNLDKRKVATKKRSGWTFLLQKRPQITLILGRFNQSWSVS